jgi:hypothetical protein
VNSQEFVPRSGHPADPRMAPGRCAASGNGVRWRRLGGKELHLRLPPCYHAHLDPDVLVLRRADGSVVARFSGRGLVAEAVEQAAWEDHGVAAEGPSPSRSPSGRRPTASRARVRPWPPRPPS